MRKIIIHVETEKCKCKPADAISDVFYTEIVEDGVVRKACAYYAIIDKPWRAWLTLLDFSTCDIIDIDYSSYDYEFV